MRAGGGDVGCDRQFSPAGARDTLSSVKGEEMVAASDVAGGLESDGMGCLWLLGVAGIFFVVCFFFLTVCSDGDTTAVCVLVIAGHAGDDGSWAHGGQDAAGVREHVEPGSSTRKKGCLKLLRVMVLSFFTLHDSTERRSNVSPGHIISKQVDTEGRLQVQ
jgi:hypothetical protein